MIVNFCFVSGTLVYTHNRGPIPIEQVMIGDIIITHENRLRKVEQTYANVLGKLNLMSFKCHKTPTCIATENHKFMALLKTNNIPMWHELKSIQVNDYIQIPEIIVDINSFNKTISFNNNIYIDGNFGTLVGLWYVFGNSDQYSVSFVFNHCDSDKEKAWIEFIGNYGQTIFGCTSTTITNMNTCTCTFECQNDDWNSVFSKVSGEINVNMYHWSDEFVRALSVIVDHPMEKTYCNPKSMEQLFYLIRSRGIIEAMNDNLKTGQTYGYIKVVDGKTFVRVHEKQLHMHDYTLHDYVYTLGVEDDHSYCVNGLISCGHNS